MGTVRALKEEWHHLSKTVLSCHILFRSGTQSLRYIQRFMALQPIVEASCVNSKDIRGCTGR